MKIKNFSILRFFIEFYWTFKIQQARQRFSGDVGLFAQLVLGKAIDYPDLNKDLLDNFSQKKALLLRRTSYKDAVIILLWQFLVFPNSRIIIVSDKPNQTRKFLWREIIKNLDIIRDSEYEYLIRDVKVKTDHIMMDKYNPALWSIGVVSNHIERITGLSDNCLIWLDNAAEIGDHIIEVANSVLAYPEKNNRLIANCGSLI